MRWFGGYKSLLELLEIYLGTLIILGVVWIAWILLRKLRRQRILPAAKKKVTDDEMATFYQVEKEKLVQSREQQNITVFFDEHGQIVDFKFSGES